ncbi:MAG: carboxylating nicotinate-nucleotide diphosphorylase [SAR202 cluster bacterium]|nr:carboxylating nicotinate-nucleotide diphosphorylase [SAR202 cluster bacterium]
MQFADLQTLITQALAEDVPSGDPTTEALVPRSATGRAALIAKAEGVLAGGEVAAAVFARVDPSLRVQAVAPDGSPVKHGSVVLKVEGSLASILKAERTALNFVQQLSGVATLTRRYVDAVAGTKAKILDTRKTTPGLRMLEKHAVRMGGGQNHRLNLSDGVLIKDNHIAAAKAQGLGLGDIVRKAREHAKDSMKVEIEVETLEQLREVLDARPDIVMLDNMDVETMRQAVKLAKGRALLEASGGVSLATVRAIAETGVEFISVGALTHSAPALDFSLEVA